MTSREELENEVAFLRYFYSAARDPFGPADYDIYCGIKEGFVRAGGTLPEAYKLETGDED